MSLRAFVHLLPARPAFSNCFC